MMQLHLEGKLALGSLVALIIFSLPLMALACTVQAPLPGMSRFLSPNDPNWLTAIGSAGRNWNK
ncbi:MAG: hypothetical protein RLZZ416_60 [Candidatus Parcubacteria bacterium]|jgi:hypothetical protein